MNLDLTWRLPVADGLTWRLATIHDAPRLCDLWNEMDRKTGEKQDRPNLFETPVVIVFVAEDESGEVVSAVYGEAVVDWVMIGTDRRAARTITNLYPTMFQFLYERSIRMARMTVPHRLAKHMAKLMPQMHEITHLYAQFVCMIRR